MIGIIGYTAEEEMERQVDKAIEKLLALKRQIAELTEVKNEERKQEVEKPGFTYEEYLENYKESEVL